MTPEVAVATYLASLSAITTLVGTRVYTQNLPEAGTLPAVRVHLITEQQTVHLRGAVSLRPSLVQVDAVAEESSGGDPYDTATTLADAIDAALTSQPPIVVGGLQLKITERLSRVPVYDPDELRQLKIAQDYRVWSQPSV